MYPRAEHRPIPEHWDQKSKDVRRLINEFRDRLHEQNYSLPQRTDGIVVLSAPPEKCEDGTFIERTQENEARIKYSFEIIKQIAAEKAGMSSEELTEDQIIQFSPKLILNGETEQLQMMVEVAHELGIPDGIIQTFNCGDRGVGNTKTQFTLMDKDPEYTNSKHLTFITTSYHVPRVVRTAEKNLSRTKEFEIIGVPYDQLEYNIYRKAKGEIKRILSYSEKGDISRFIKEPATPLIEFGTPINTVDQHYSDETTPLSPQAEKLLQALTATLRRDHGEPNPFNGELINVDGYSFLNGKLDLQTSKTDYYSYLASSYAHREDQQENSVRPLAVSATLLSPEGKILVEERSGVTELEGKLAVFGGAMKPGEKPEEAIAERLKRKMGLEIQPENIYLTGADQENLQNIFEIFYLVKLERGQLEQLKSRFQEPMNKIQKKFSEFSVNQDLHEIEDHFHNKDITDWNPSSFYNIMYALIKNGDRTPEEVSKIVEYLRKKITRKPFRYKYPYEQIVD
ncbi:MAG: NUDIX domain-containing protein [Patescibacteria group bacterium]